MYADHDITGYTHRNGRLNHSHRYLLPELLKTLQSLGLSDAGQRVFDLGCGNGALAGELDKRGYEVTGVDPSAGGIYQANHRHPVMKLHHGSAYDDLSAVYGKFPVVISFEVIEHVYSPRKFARTMYGLLEEGGVAIVSTPYHGYCKNLALALAGRMDKHFSPLWDHGHIKFWSVRSLTALLEETGFRDVSFRRVGRIPPLAKSMIAISRK